VGLWASELEVGDKYDHDGGDLVLADVLALAARRHWLVVSIPVVRPPGAVSASTRNVDVRM